MNKRKQWEKLRLKRLLTKKDDKTMDEEKLTPEETPITPEEKPEESDEEKEIEQ